VAVERDRVASRVVDVPLHTEDPLAFRVQKAVSYEFVDAAAGLECRIERDPGLGPLTVPVEFGLVVVLQTRVLDVDRGCRE